jgi:hypothetical protein
MGGVMRRRIWCERVAPGELGDRSTARLLGRFGVEAVIALPPEAEGPELGAALTELARADVAIVLAPLATQGEGFGAAEGAEAARRVESALEFAQARGVPVKGVALRLGRGWTSGRGLRRRLPAALVSGWTTGRSRHEIEVLESERALARLARELRSRAIEASAELSLFPALDLDLGRRRLSPLFDVAGSGVGWDVVAARVASPVLARYGVPRPAARGALAASAAFMRSAAGDRAALTVGRVGRGPTGDGPLLSTPRALRRDVAVLRGAGVDDLWLDGLEGVLRRGRPEAWLEALAHGERRAASRLARWSTEAVLRALRGP